MVCGDGLKLLQRPWGDPRHASVGLVVRQAEPPGETFALQLAVPVPLTNWR
jgi:hypothetical protein